MIISIKNDDGSVTSWDVGKISDEKLRNEATVIINKVGTLETMVEATSFASQTFRNNLVGMLKDREEAIVPEPEPEPEAEVEEVEEEAVEESEGDSE